MKRKIALILVLSDREISHKKTLGINGNYNFVVYINNSYISFLLQFFIIKTTTQTNG